MIDGEHHIFGPDEDVPIEFQTIDNYVSDDYKGCFTLLQWPDICRASGHNKVVNNSLILVGTAMLQILIQTCQAQIG